VYVSPSRRFGMIQLNSVSHSRKQKLAKFLFARS
jgi:hypothetical protein